ncbi:MAG TPA: magnesium-translocating P-type ATPase [Opitutaceae bacterium]|nr:magnesium-translocating P-type ATPase [Opitutaceae bacterium]HUJ42263.1 magnesium-translocating P-type ATPase [Opitutaceae bacterium]
MKPPTNLYSIPETELFSQLGTSGNGLSVAGAAEVLDRVGPNTVVVGHRHSVLLDLLDRCRNPLVIQLLVIALVSYLMGDLRSTLVVGGMLFLSVFLSYFQETRSSRAVEKLQKLVRTTVTVVRDGHEVEVLLEEVVPGDVVVLAAGSLIPADLRIISAKDFFVTQSALTGESMPVEKNADAVPAAGRAAFEYSNACFMGSNVLSGSARGVVVTTGAGTFFGSLAEKLGAKREATSFDKGVRGFTWLMIRFMVIMVSITFLIVGLTKHNWAEALVFALSVAVGLTPEMLPMIMTVCLSKGALMMARKKVIVKHLHAIQNFGAMDVLCTDKTGTLTQDHVVLERYVDVTNRPSEDVLRYAYMNSFYQTGLRNLLDRAILAHTELDVERNCRKVDEIPFDFKRRRMSVVIDYEDRHVLVCKGAVEEVAAVCDNYQVDEDINPLIRLIRDDLMDEYRNLSAQGYRVLAIAYREFDRSKQTFSVADESELILLGYIAFFDPAKDTAAKAIEALARSGVAVKILTGDNELVTRKVCHDVAMSVTRVATGPQLAALDEAGFGREVNEANVFARLTPDQKEKVIKTLRGQGRVVGFMGDGINDVLAMKAADVGISVDTAVDVAKESADIILLEKSLLVLEDGIIEGRKVFGNIIKYIKMGASSNFGNMFSVVGGAYFLPFLPMAPIQVLVNNLLYDFSQVGIPLDNVDREYLDKPRRWNIKSIQNFMVFIGPISSVFDYATFFLMLYFFGCIHLDLPAPAALARFFAHGVRSDATYSAALFHTGWFVESILTQTLIVHIIRTHRIPFIQSRASKTMSFTTVLIMAVGIWLPYSPVGRYLGLVPLPPVYFIWVTGFLIGYSFLTHSVKMWFARKFGTD